MDCYFALCSAGAPCIPVPMRQKGDLVNTYRQELA